MRDRYKVLFEVYDKNINSLSEKKEKSGDRTPDGEAILSVDYLGSKRWRNKTGQLHNRFGPAVEEITRKGKGYTAWYINGRFHREDGPALILPLGDKHYFLDDKEYSYEDWKKEVDSRQRNRLTKDIYKKGSEDSGLDLSNL